MKRAAKKINASLTTVHACDRGKRICDGATGDVLDVASRDFYQAADPCPACAAELLRRREASELCDALRSEGFPAEALRRAIWAGDRVEMASELRREQASLERVRAMNVGLRGATAACERAAVVLAQISVRVAA